MMKKGIIIGTALVGITGGFILAQNTLFGSAEVQISASEAKKVALEAYNGKVIDFDHDLDDTTPHYEFEILNGNEKAEVEVDATTGKATITETETVKNNAGSKVENVVDGVTTDAKIAAANVAKSPSTDKAGSEDAKATNDATPAISKSEAIKIANTVAKGTVVKVELDNDDNQYKYEIELRDGNIEYDVEIDANSGQIIEFDQDQDND